MTIYHWLIIACWLVFVGYWLVSAFKTKSNVEMPTRALGRRALVVLAILVLFPSQITDWLGGHDAAAPHPVRSGIGVILCAAGIAFAIWARRHLGANWGMPMAVKDQPELVTSGPYALVRHPIYAGVFLALLGSALVSSLAWLIPTIAAAAYFLLSAHTEEKLMMSQFPEQYSDYRTKTKMLVPWLY